MPKKGALDSLPIPGRAWQDRGGGVFEGGGGIDTQMHTTGLTNSSFGTLFSKKKLFSNFWNVTNCFFFLNMSKSIIAAVNSCLFQVLYVFLDLY